MKIRIAIIATCVGTLALALAASTGAFAQGVHINNDGLGQADRGSQKVGPALPRTPKQKAEPVAAQTSIFDRWGNLKSKK